MGLLGRWGRMGQYGGGNDTCTGTIHGCIGSELPI